LLGALAVALTWVESDEVFALDRGNRRVVVQLEYFLEGHFTLHLDLETGFGAYKAEDSGPHPGIDKELGGVRPGYEAERLWLAK
jgi:hypothetical protein